MVTGFQGKEMPNVGSCCIFIDLVFKKYDDYYSPVLTNVKTLKKKIKR